MTHDIASDILDTSMTTANLCHEAGNPEVCTSLATMIAAERRLDAIMEHPAPSPATLARAEDEFQSAMLAHDQAHRPSAQMLLEIKARYPDDYYLAGCLRQPLETDPHAFPWYPTPHQRCGCPECEDAHIRTIRARADLVREHIRNRRQQMLV